MKKLVIIFLFCILLTSSVSANGYEIFYYHNDHLGNPVAITNEDGEVVWKADYEPFGEVFNEENIQTTNKFNYNSKELDKNTNLLYYGARFYDSDIGRFTTADTVKGSLGNPQSLNRYSYVLNNPLKYVDPDGCRISISGSQKKREQVLGWMNDLVGENIFDIDDEGQVTSNKDFSGSEDQEKIFNMFKDVIGHEDTVTIVTGNSKSIESGFFPEEKVRILAGKNSVKTSVYSAPKVSVNLKKGFEPMGKGGELILFEQRIILTHEMAHAYDYLYKDNFYEIEIEESFAVDMENAARRSLGIKERYFYGGYTLKTEYSNEIVREALLFTPEQYDAGEYHSLKNPFYVTDTILK